MRSFILIATFIVCSGGHLCADESAKVFEKRLLPLLKQHCFECHSAKADEVKGGLKLDDAEEILKGGASGPAVLPGNVEDSFLLRAIRYQEDDYQMPPRGRMSDEDIAAFEAWVKALGAEAKR